MTRAHRLARGSAAPRGRVLGTAVAVVAGGFGLAQLETIEGWVWGAVVGALACAVFAARSYVLNARHRRSLEALLGQARQLGDASRGNQDVEPPADGLAAEVSAAMSLSALRLRSQLAQERTFSGQAAHQLRTPLTALGLQLEELTMDPETPRRVRAEVHRCRNEVDRLAEIIADLLALARRGALPTGRYRTDPAVVAVHATHRWASLARAAGRELRVAGTLPECEVQAPAGPTSQVLDVLIDNALKHGTGDIEVSVRVMADSVRLRVADQGMRPWSREPATAGEGMGLEVAEKLAAACGGQMVRAPIPTTAFDLVLPR